MFDLTKVEHIKCPYCEIIINDWQYFTANLFAVDPRYLILAKCPSCSEEFGVRRKLELTFETKKRNGE